MEDILKQADQYQLNALCTGLAHYKSAEKAEKMHNWLSIPVVVTTTIVGAGIFASISSNPDFIWKVIAGLISLIAAALSSLQTFFKFSERTEKHKSAGAQYSALRKQIEIFKLQHGNTDEKDRAAAILELDRIAKRLADLASSSPNITDEVYNLAKAEIEQK